MKTLKNTLEVLLLQASENPDLRNFNSKKYYFIMHKYNQVLAGSYENGEIKTMPTIETDTSENSILELRIFNETANLFFKKVGAELKLYKPILKTQLVQHEHETKERSEEIDTKFTGSSYKYLILTEVYDHDENNLAYVKYEYLEQLSNKEGSVK